MSRMIEISDETFKKLKDQLTEDEQINISFLDDFIGKSFLFRTVTYHILGKVVKIIGKIVFLEQASWIADSGRFSDFIKKGLQEKSEIEPLGNWYVNLESCTDFGIWKHKLPTEQK